MTLEKRIFNRTFSLGGDGISNLNACVGNNGFVDKLTYANGFSKAAKILMDAVIADDINIFVDDIVYPICFNARHHIELFLKWAISNVAAIRSIPSAVNLSKTHDLKKLFDEYVRLCNLTDSRLDEISKKMSEYITDFAQIDPTGETFRYPFNQKNSRHLQNTPVVNIVIFQMRYLELCKIIEEFVEMVLFVTSEYKTGTFTSKLSRKEIEQIARSLPPYVEWRDLNFGEIRAEIKANYTLNSNKDFIRVIDIIKAHREFSALIGKEILVPNISIDTFDRFNLVLNQCAVSSTLSKEEWATLMAMYEISHSQHYSENFDFLYEENLRDLQYREAVSDFIDRVTYRGDCLITAMKKTGQLSFLEKFVHCVDFESAKRKRKESFRLFNQKLLNIKAKRIT